MAAPTKTAAREATVNITLDLEATARPAPVAVNFGTVAQFDTDISMLLGWFDLYDFARKSKLGSTGSQPFNVTHHFQMSIGSFERLRDQLNKLHDHMLANRQIQEPSK